MVTVNTPLTTSSQKRILWKNVVALVAGVGIFTMGLNPIDDLQSSLNDDGGLGIGSLGVKYAFMIFGNLFTNTLIIRMFGSKRALVFGTLLYSLYIVANFYPTWATMMPMTVLAGLGGALMWTTQSHYLAALAQDLAELQLQSDNADVTVSADNVKTLIFGYRGMAIRLFAIFGGIASSIILSIGRTVPQMTVVKYRVGDPLFYNATYKNLNADSFGDALGAYMSRKFSSNHTRHNITEPGQLAEKPKIVETSTVVSDTRSRASVTAVYTLCAFCCMSALLGGLLMLFGVDPLLKVREKAEEAKLEDTDTTCSLLFATARLWKRKEQLLIIPTTIACGFQEAFWRANFNKTPVTCGLGIEQIVIILMCYNTAMLVGSLMCRGWLGNRRSRMIAYPSMAVLDVLSLSVMFLWKYENEWSTTVAYVATAITGTMYGAITSLLPALYGILFSNDLEAAYSNLFFWCFMGSTLMYALSYSLPLAIKLVSVVVMIIIGLGGYLAIESKTKQKCTQTRLK